MLKKASAVKASKEATASFAGNGRMFHNMLEGANSRALCVLASDGNLYGLNARGNRYRTTVAIASDEVGKANGAGIAIEVTPSGIVRSKGYAVGVIASFSGLPYRAGQKAPAPYELVRMPQDANGVPTTTVACANFAGELRDADGDTEVVDRMFDFLANAFPNDIEQTATGLKGKTSKGELALAEIEARLNGTTASAAAAAVANSDYIDA